MNNLSQISNIEQPAASGQLLPSAELAADKITELLQGTPYFGGLLQEVTSNDLAKINELIEGLSASALEETIALLPDDVLKTWADEIDDSTLYGMGGLTDNEKEQLASMLVGQLSESQLDRVLAQFEGTSIGQDLLAEKQGINLQNSSTLENVPSPTTVYVVKSGDSLSAIAVKFNVPLQDLIQENNIANPNMINVGDEIKIPLPQTTSVEPASTGKAEPAIKIDYDFISAREGGRMTKGYVPNPKESQSGVTVATGFDLGQRTRQDLESLGLPESLIKKLEPYLGAKKEDAVKLLQDKPLTITNEEAKIIDRQVKAESTKQIIAAYNKATPPGSPDFEDLPAEAQTVIASVAFQYGSDLASRTPKFWEKVMQQDWKGAVEELRNFGDDYPTRRNLEADLMDKISK